MGKLYAGIDSGSWTTKVMVIDEHAGVKGSALVRSAADLAGASERALTTALSAAGVGRQALSAIWATGFGRGNVAVADGTRTELDCHARGVRHYLPGAATIVDIGGQDAKVIRIDDEGRRISHRMNRKCAAGTGSFLEEMALRLGISIEDFHDFASGYREEVELGSYCTVFSGTELLAAIRRGQWPPDLARAAYKSVVARVLEMEALGSRIVATGGVVAHHPVVVELMARALDAEVLLPPHPQEIGAFGAALAARDAIDSVRARVTS